MTKKIKYITMKFGDVPLGSYMKLNYHRPYKKVKFQSGRTVGGYEWKENAITDIIGPMHYFMFVENNIMVKVRIQNIYS